MIFRSGTAGDDLRRHLAALQAAGEVLSEQFEEAAASARRVARALRRLGEDSGRTELAEAALNLLESNDKKLAANLDSLISQLREEVEDSERPRGTILVVEDDPLPAKLLGQALAKGGWQITVAETAEQAELALSEKDVAAVVLDLVLPDADGRNLLLRLKEDPRASTIPVYVASARSDPHVRAECLALGAEDFFDKPVDPDRLLRAIERSGQAAYAVSTESKPQPSIADRAALSREFRAAPTTSRVIALISIDSPVPQLHDALDHTAKIISGTVRDEGRVARWSAEHLVVFFPDTHPGQACERIDEARETLLAAEAVGDLFAGVVSLRADETLERALDEAGLNLYLARTAGGGKTVCDPEQTEPATVRILVAEDDEVAAKLLSYRLSREPGFEVVHGIDGNDALEKACERHIDLAILDVHMPGIDGFDLLIRLRAMSEYADLPIMMLTSLGSERDVVRGFELGANDYVTKPFSPIELLARVRRLLAGKAGRS